MSQILLFEPQKGLEDAAIANLAVFKRWAEDGRITWQQYFRYRRQAEYSIFMRNERQKRAAK